MLLVIDNYDSFTYNLVHYAQELGAKTKVVRNDEISVSDAISIGAMAFCFPRDLVLQMKQEYVLI